MHTEPFWVVELFVDAGFFNRKRRDTAQIDVGKAFVTVLGSSIDWGCQHIAPTYMKSFYCLFIEIPAPRI